MKVVVMKAVVRMSKEQVAALNTMAKVDWERAKAMLDGINLVLGTDYGWLASRVTIKDEDGKLRDAWANAEWEDKLQ